MISALDTLINRRLKELRELDRGINPVARVEKGQYLAPTPRLGERVIWYQANQADKAYAADVVKIERPGQVQLRLVKPKNDEFAAPNHVLGVRHRSDPVHDGLPNPTSVQTGSWDYLAGDKIPETDYQMARDELAVREKNTLAAEQKAAERRKAIEAQAVASQNSVPLSV